MSFEPNFDPLDDALDYLIFEDVTKEKDPDDWDDDSEHSKDNDVPTVEVDKDSHSKGEHTLPYTYDNFGKFERKTERLVLSVQTPEEDSSGGYLVYPTILYFFKISFNVRVYDKEENLIRNALGTFVGLKEIMKSGKYVYVKFSCTVLDDEETFSFVICMMEEQYSILLEHINEYSDKIRNNPSDISKHSGDLSNMSGVEFEQLILRLVKKMDFEAQTTKTSGDGGIDIVAYNQQPFFEGKYIIQCKRWNSSVGEPILRDLYGVVTSERANKGIIVSTSYFTQSAINFADGKPIELIDGNKLNLLLERYGIVDF